jgi:hypothetical protein
MTCERCEKVRKLRQRYYRRHRHVIKIAATLHVPMRRARKLVKAGSNMGTRGDGA